MGRPWLREGFGGLGFRVDGLRAQKRILNILFEVLYQRDTPNRTLFY